MLLLQVEFNKAAQSLTEALVPSAQKKTALSRLVKVSYRICQVVPYCFLKNFISELGLYLTSVCLTG